MKKHVNRYLTEADVKRALKIDSFRNLTKDKIMQFASMIPDMDKEVAMAVINQYPDYKEFLTTAISTYKGMCENVLMNNKESQEAVMRGYQTILDNLSDRLKTCESEEARKAITEDMIAVADKIADADLNNKRFLEHMMHYVLAGIGLFVVAAGAVLGIRAVVGGSDELPQLDDEDI